MNKGLGILLAMMMLLSPTACTTAGQPEGPAAPPGNEQADEPAGPDAAPENNAQETPSPDLSDGAQEEAQNSQMKLQIGDQVFTATLSDNSSAEALKELLSEGPLTVEMRDYASMEKVGPLGETLPRNDEQITTEPGDLILYQGNALVIYYDTNSWNFTRLGKINDVTKEALMDALGDGDVSVTLSLE